MIEYIFLLVVFLVLYIAECAVAVPAGSVAFRLSLNPNRHIKLLTKVRNQPRPEIAFAIPFTLRSDVVVCRFFPLSLSPAGIVSGSGADDREAKAEFIAFDDMRRIESEQGKLLVNNSVAVANCAEAQTKDLVRFLKHLKEMSQEERISAIETLFAQMFDPGCVDARLREFTENTYDLSLDSLLLPVMMILGGSIMVWWRGLVASWPILLSYLVFNAALIAWDFRQAVRKLFPSEGTTYWSAIAMILLSPPAAARATRYVAKDIGHNFHPLAFAASRCSDTEFRNLASWMLRQSMFADALKSVDGRHDECTLWFRLKIHEHIVALIRRNGHSPEEIIAPTQRESNQVRSYCPRCLSQFVISDGLCSDCGGISLRPFDSSE